jgi:hypothetical protein
VKSIELKCACGRVLKVSGGHAGKLGRCKGCGAEIRIPGPGREPGGQAAMDEWATVPLSVDDSSAARPSTERGARGRDPRHEMLVRLLRRELAECGFEPDELDAFFPSLTADSAQGSRAVEADLEFVQTLRFRIERRTEERVRRELTERVTAALAFRTPDQQP